MGGGPETTWLRNAVPKTIYRFSRRRNQVIHRPNPPLLSPLSIPTLRVGRAGWNQISTKTALAVFDVGEMIPRINRKLNADLVTLSKAGRTVLSKGTHSKTPAASN